MFNCKTSSGENPDTDRINLTALDRLMVFFKKHFVKRKTVRIPGNLTLQAVPTEIRKK